MSTYDEKHSGTRRTFWTITAFYLLIAFEFFYMASPFAMYFYSVYGPGLKFINDNAALAWLSSTFLPHIVVETSSVLVNLHNIVGGLLVAVGFLGFCVCAIQIYYSKLTRKKAVTGGVYNFIRHPQYLLLSCLQPGFVAVVAPLHCAPVVSGDALRLLLSRKGRRSRV